MAPTHPSDRQYGPLVQMGCAVDDIRSTAWVCKGNMKPKTP